jgi:peptide subunit release factor 1 (eRF1)
MGQVDELLIAGRPDAIDTGARAEAGSSEEAEAKAVDELIAKARQTAARITIVQDGSLLAAVGGVGALLRFKL